MVTPYLYPKTKHVRSQTPPAYRDYRSFKPHLRIEFSAQCVYCRALDGLKGSEAFGVDHYRPQKHFLALALEYLNLYYACNRCNSFKRDFWPNAKQKAARQFVPNPCEHVMTEHLRHSRGSVEATSPAGVWTADLLDLNSPEQLEYRAAVMAAYKGLGALIATCEETLRQAKAKERSAKTSANKAAAANAVKKAEANLAKIVAKRDTLFGA